MNGYEFPYIPHPLPALAGLTDQELIELRIDIYNDAVAQARADYSPNPTDEACAAIAPLNAALDAEWARREAELADLADDWAIQCDQEAYWGVNQ